MALHHLSLEWEECTGVKNKHLADAHSWSYEMSNYDAQELEKLAMVAEQDTFNMQRVHQGLKVLRREGVLLSRYQESIVRWRQDLIQEYVELGPR